jgi:hypothetical protein
MAELTPTGFRTAAYLEAKARLDKRQGKTRNNVECNPPNKRCGNRCIPPNWDCRIKGEGSDAHLKAVKTDPLGGIASIERGTKRIVRGISRGSFSDVEGGKKSIIRGAVKIAPGNIEQKKQLKTTLENRTRAIGIGLAVVTGGLSVHAILMKGNTFGYRDGLGRDINNAVRSGVNNVLDAVPILGSQRRAVRSQASTDVTSAAIRLGRTQTAGPVALSEQLDIPTSNALGQVRGTTIAQRNIESAGKLTRTINEVNTNARERNSNIYSWNEAHRQAFWNVKTKEQDISNKEINIFAKPAAEDFLRSQYAIPPSADTSSALKNALQEQIRLERDNYVSLARQQGFRIQRRDNRDIIHPDDNARFVRNLVRSTAGTGVMSREARNSIEDHVQSVLNQAPSTYTNKLYRETVLGFDTFYNKVGSTSRSVAGVASGTTEVDPRRTFNFDPQRIPTIPRRERDILEAADEMRSRYMLNQMRGNGNSALSISGTGHSELTRIAYFATRVNGTNNSSYSVTDRVAKAAASELAGRPVTSTTEAFTLLRTQYGFTGATEVRPASGATPNAPRGRETRGQRSQRGLTELARSIMARPGNENMSLATALRQARSEQRSDSPEHDLPPRVRAFLEHRADLKEAPRLGKPCGESHIPKTHECRKGQGPAASPRERSNSSSGRTVVLGVLGAAAGVAALMVATDAARYFRNKQLPATGNYRQILKTQLKKDGLTLKDRDIALGNYYDNVSKDWKLGEVVYYKNEKERKGHFGVYLGKRDGKHQFAAAGNQAAIGEKDPMRANGIISITEYGSNAKYDGAAVIWAKAPASVQPPRKYSDTEIVRRASLMLGKPYKLEMLENNCESWASMIVSGVPHSTQVRRFSAVTQGILKARDRMTTTSSGQGYSSTQMATWLAVNHRRFVADSAEYSVTDLKAPADVVKPNMNELEAMSTIKNYLMVLVASPT